MSENRAPMVSEMKVTTAANIAIPLVFYIYGAFDSVGSALSAMVFRVSINQETV